MPRPQGFRQGRLLPVGRPVRVGARAFSQDLDRALEHVAPGLELLDLAPQRPDEPPELVGIVRRVVSVSHRAGHLLAEQTVLPPVEDIPGDPIRLRHLGGRALPGHERHDGVGHPVGRDGTRQRGPAPGRCQLVHPVGKHLVAAGIPERTPGPGIAPPMPMMTEPLVPMPPPRGAELPVIESVATVDAAWAATDSTLSFRARSFAVSVTEPSYRFVPGKRAAPSSASPKSPAVLMAPSSYQAARPPPRMRFERRSA